MLVLGLGLANPILNPNPNQARLARRELEIEKLEGLNAEREARRAEEAWVRDRANPNPNPNPNLTLTLTLPLTLTLTLP